MSCVLIAFGEGEERGELAVRCRTRQKLYSFEGRVESRQRTNGCSQVMRSSLHTLFRVDEGIINAARLKWSVIFSPFPRENRVDWRPDVVVVVPDGKTAAAQRLHSTGSSQLMIPEHPFVAVVVDPF